MNSKKDLPKLRFQEFTDEWQSTNVKNVSRVIGGGTPSTSIEKYWNGDINWFTPSEINEIYVSDSKRKISLKGLRKSSASILPKGTILLTTRATIGEMSIALKECTTNQGFQSIIVNKNHSIYFLFNLLKLKKRELIKRANGSTFLEISKKEVEKIKIKIPSLPEQQKIASFLSAVDKRIELHQKKKDLLEDYKKGVMQQLFSQQIRFKDENGNDFPDWEEKKLGKVCYKQSSSISANQIEENYGDFIIYGASGKLKKIDFFTQEDSYISIVKDGAGVGRTFICQPRTSVLGTMDVIKTKTENLYFIFCLLNNIEFRKYITGSTIPHIYFKDYSKEKIFIPSLKEQQKIASFLSAIDFKIETTNQQIEGLQTFKKGLLQQMFV